MNDDLEKLASLARQMTGSMDPSDAEVTNAWIDRVVANLRGPRKRLRSGINRCSRCKKLGHTRTTCPAIIVVDTLTGESMGR